MPFPENKFFLRVLIMNLMTLFWAAILAWLTKTIPPLSSILKSFLSMMC